MAVSEQYELAQKLATDSLSSETTTRRGCDASPRGGTLLRGYLHITPRKLLCQDHYQELPRDCWKRCDDVGNRLLPLSPKCVSPDAAALLTVTGWRAGALLWEELGCLLSPAQARTELQPHGLTWF